ncbi:hypothetical protein ASG12_14215 [Williamsia sp. Leaf354]|jgi:ubiquinol-cytochrome c reductase cytochrome b subunit|uniref:hypothetical protein n=1 Tax=Williamsia sp. Leaf354 TaxID=1736349 RepID=UPI0006F37925|nr:hypothetical protein [Williamsia sp. Leaf354]KQR98109.1 hypothetical protein ASG12_14215 [Williamsia sp. Leaf354]
MDAERILTGARRLRRASWWVYVVVALAAGRVSWLDLGNERTVTYHGSYEPLEGVELSKAYSTSLEIDYAVRGGLEWTGIVTACAAALVVLAALVQAAYARPRPMVAVFTVLASPVAILAVAVAVAVNGIGGITFRLSLAVLIVLVAAAVHEYATTAAQRRRDP